MFSILVLYILLLYILVLYILVLYIFDKTLNCRCDFLVISEAQFTKLLVAVKVSGLLFNLIYTDEASIWLAGSAELQKLFTRLNCLVPLYFSERMTIDKVLGLQY